MRRDHVAQRIRMLSPAKKRLLERLLAEGSYDASCLEMTPAAPRSPVEADLVGIWQEVLGLERVGVEDNFFDLGGDSILSIRIVAKAQKRAIPLTSRLLFEAPTIAQLARRMELAGAPPQEGATVSVAGHRSRMESLAVEESRRQRAFKLTPADFPEAELSQEDLTRILSLVVARADLAGLESPPPVSRRAAAV